MSDSATPKDMRENYDDEISLKDLVLKLQEFWREMWKYWWMVILFCIPFLAFFLYKHVSHIKTYKANLSFMVNEDEGGGGLSAVSGVLGSFGLGGSVGGEYNLEKMLSLLKSRKIIQEVLLDTLEMDGHKDFFANHLILSQELHEEWEDLDIDDVDLRGFLFSHPKISKFTLNENTVLKYLHTLLIGNADKGIENLLTSNITDDTGIMEIGITSRNEILSIALTEALYERLSKFYVDKSIEKHSKTFEIISSKADSLQGELRSSEYALAVFKDTNRGLYNRKDQLEEFRLEAKAQMLGAAFLKVVEQKEIAEFTLNDKTPVVQIIDYPISPIEPSESHLIKDLVLACFIGGFLSLLFIIGRKILRDALV